MDARSLNAVLPYAFGDEIDYLNMCGAALPFDAEVVMLGIGPAVLGMALLETAQCKCNFTGVDYADFTGVQHLLLIGYKINVLEGYSWEVSDEFPDSVVDFLMIDACHTQECVEKDIEAWLAKVRPGGTIFFHDYVPQESDAPGNGVKTAVENYRHLLGEEIARPGCSIVFRKL